MGAMSASAAADSFFIDNGPTIVGIIQNIQTPIVAKDFDFSFANPSRGVSVITVELGKNNFDKTVSLSVYDVTGKLVRVLNRNSKSADASSFVWNGKNDSNRNVASGRYLYKLQAGTNTKIKQLIYIQ